jgi:hypothetical protein
VLPNVPPWLRASSSPTTRSLDFCRLTIALTCDASGLVDQLHKFRKNLAVAVAIALAALDEAVDVGDGYPEVELVRRLLIGL